MVENPKRIAMWERLRDEWSDEIPEEIVHGRSFKARKVFFANVALSLQLACEKGEIANSDVVEEVSRFIDDYAGSDEFHDRLTTDNDIARANDILDEILGRK